MTHTPPPAYSVGGGDLLSADTTFYLSERRRERRRTGIRRLLILLLVPLLILLLFNARLRPNLEVLAAKATEQKTEGLIASAVYRELSSQATRYADIVTLSYKENGSVAALRTDTGALLALRTRLSLAALSSLSDEDLRVEVPIASLFGLNFLPSRPSVPFTLRLTKSLNAYFTSSFTECGINQTRHRVLFCFEISIAILIPGGTKTVTVLREFPLTETVIVGDIPDAYTKIDRLTDDITETEIDDLYDYGAHQN